LPKSSSLLLVTFSRSFCCACGRSDVAAENLFLRKQLGLYVERKIKPRRATHSIRFTLAQLSHFFDWQRSHDGEARHADTLASPWIPIVLEMEIATSRPSTYTCQLAAAYS
jgi:hypothetical protein